MTIKTPDARYAATVAKYLREGRGRGTGENYRPWLTVRTKGLNSNTWRPYGQNGRTYHLLSNIEFAMFMLLDRSPATVDIREQFPLLPLDETRRIAAEIGCPHPRACPFQNKGESKVDIVMTTDLVVDLTDEPDLPATIAISIKRAEALDCTTSAKLRNLLNKAEIERRYWQERNVPFLMITERDAPSVVLENVDLLHRFTALKGVELPTSLEELAAHLLDRIEAAPDLPVRDHGAVFDKTMGLPRGTGTNLIWHCIAAGRWKVDLTTKLDAASPLVDVAGVENFVEAGS